MKKIIIFDFNRTLYDPETEKLMPETHKVLKTLREHKFQLYLVTHAEKARLDTLEKLGITAYFTHIRVSKNKTKTDFDFILSLGPVDKSQSYVVGDSVKKEIAFGNACQLKTLWVRTGKFADDWPTNLLEMPTYVVSALKDVPYLLIK